MATDRTASRILNELDRALDALNADLDRVEILSGALAAFSIPVPEYEPMFHHLHAAGLVRHELTTGSQS